MSLPQPLGQRAISTSPDSCPSESLISLKSSTSSEIDRRRPSRCAARAQGEIEEFVEHRAVGKVREFVVIGEEGDLRLGRLAFGDVEHHALDECGGASAVGEHHRTILEPDHVPVARDQPVLQENGSPESRPRW